MTGTRKVRMRWRRTATLIIVVYLLYWSGVSVDHMWVIWHQERALNQKIAAVKSRNQVFSQDIKDLHNPATLKQMLTGKTSLPNVGTAP